MSAFLLNQNVTAIGPNLTTYFTASGGTAPYVYSVRAGGAGGSINPSTGAYTAPVATGNTPVTQSDIVQVIDNVKATASASILVGNPLLLFCDVISNQLGLARNRVYLWDQKIMQPTDVGMYVAIAVLRKKIFANTNKFDGSGSNSNSDQSCNVMAMLQVDAISRDSSARDHAEDIILAINSDYSQSQQEINGFYIGKLPPGSQFINVSGPDGAAIPYRYSISIAMQYFYTKTQAVPYFGTFDQPAVTTEP